MKNWIQIQTHLHASNEQYASMRSHAAMARELGYDAIFITEHDVRMNYQEAAICDFVLSGYLGAAETGDGEARPAVWENGAGWYEEKGIPARAVRHQGSSQLLVEPGKRPFFFSPGKKHQVSLAAALTLSLDLDAGEAEGVRICAELSLRPDQHQQKLYYELGTVPKNEDPYGWTCSLSPSPDGHYELKLSEDALSFDPFGLDNAFLTVAFEAFGGPAYVGGFSTHRLYAAESLRIQMQNLADRIGREFGLALYVGTEVTTGYGHRCSYSAQVPVIDYKKSGFGLTTQQVTGYMTCLGGTYSFNHMYESYKGLVSSPEETPPYVERMIAELTETNCEGAHLLEVGFPDGRGVFTLKDYLYTWDRLGMNGVRITGIGDSDCHDSRVRWKDGNNFAVWLGADSLRREDLEKAMRTGRAFTGDPARWHGEVSFTVEDKAVGDDLPVRPDQPVSVHVSLSGIEEPVRLCLILAGKQAEESVLSAAQAELSYSISRGAYPIAPVRMELWGADGRLLLLSNPVYLISPRLSRPERN